MGPVHSRPVSVRGSFADLHSDPGIDRRYHVTAPPDSNEQPGPGVVEYEGPPIGAMVADGVKRYEKCIPRNDDASDTTVPAMTIAFPVHNHTVPPGWITVVHPEGSRYFVNPEKRTFTEINVCNEEMCEDVKYYMKYLLDELESELKRKGSLFDMKQVDLVLELKQAPDGISAICLYYFANHRDRCLFWLDEFDAKKVLSDCKGITNISHKGLAIQAQYWRHWDYFPNLCPVAQTLVDEVKNMLVHAKCDHLTSKQSSAAYDVNELRDYLDIVTRITVCPTANQSMEQCHVAIVIGRIMNTFSHNAFINFHGENCARLSFEQTVYGWAYIRSWWMVVFTAVLFLEPETQVQELHKIFADKITRTSRWNVFSSKLKSQLQESNILASLPFQCCVLAAINVKPVNRLAQRQRCVPRFE
ncbi:hypothetical protein K503DRAFT_343916 [Rhizopogon vinicolor AM-OR11-026]|uniref:WW domain-containing protein n=1 Tax=Rhizopogon vinicolor AM-OR11-026 TaxID=1314800 RepID=A0A1B7MTD0_9AGAM|nr:hypothetical protein K503DRAFT_343916 [Rhizopogon vinicolor AM-OR11-026]